MTSCSGPAFICLMTYVSVCQTTWTTSKAEPGRPLKPHPTAWAAPPTLFAVKKIPKYSRVGALLIGVGIGLGVGLLIAPARGEEMRADIADKVSDFGEKVREHIGKKPQGATGTYGE